MLTHTAAGTQRESEKERVQSNSGQVVGGRRSCAIGTAVPSWQPERNSEKDLEVDTMTFRTEDLKIYPLIKMTLT